jgi:transposase InsO family protein
MAPRSARDTKKLGWRVLHELTTTVTPETLLPWHRELIARKYDGSRRRGPGRSRSDNGPQFAARDFKEFIHICGITHVRTSPFYAQSNGKIERWHQSLKGKCVRPGAPLWIDDACRLVGRYVDHYDRVRLHSACVGAWSDQAHAIDHKWINKD